MNSGTPEPRGIRTGRAVTPPRPVDVVALFPELAAHARTTVRLHPVPADPGPHDSSVGGPPAWPADEPWPTCPGGRHLGEGTAGSEGCPLLPVLQVHARDLPWYGGFPAGTDVLQLLWCPFQHFYADPAARSDQWIADRTAPYNGVAGPWVQVRHRRSGGPAERLLTAPPRPAVLGSPHYLPTPCLLRPEPVTEYPHPGVLGEEFEARVEAWERANFADPDDPDEYDPRYSWEFSVAPGWKLGGHEPWNYQGYDGPVRCGACGCGMRFVAALASAEWDGGGPSWKPVVHGAEAGAGRKQEHEPTGIVLGDWETMRVFVCSRSADHPVVSDLK
ncbi:hypothetical protein ACFV6F_07945 [Kitasatospora phosalacinea]|uniref:hypothetical protein n=1 Tax=Kitasatospora phosalacinea TaxID=2065 RepID=UPI00366657B0